MDQKPFSCFSDLSHLVEVCEVLVIAENFPPQLPNALPLALNGEGERGGLGRGRCQCSLSHQQFGPGADIVTGSLSWPGNAQRHSPSENGWLDVSDPRNRVYFPESRQPEVGGLEDHLRSIPPKVNGS